MILVGLRLVAFIGTIVQKVKQPISNGLISSFSLIKLGKRIGGCLYVHRSQSWILPDTVQQTISNIVIPFSFTIIKYCKKGDQISLIECEDWDTADEPVVGRSFVISHDGKTKIVNPPSDPWIYHHKWMFVSEDYTGFDVSVSKARSEKWTSIKEIDCSRIGKRSYWRNVCNQYEL